MKKIYIYKPKILFFLLIILIFNLGIITRRDLDLINNNENISMEVYTVKKGDSYWTIADKYNYNNKLSFIYDIEYLNKMSSESLQPGYKILIPIYENK